MGKSRGFTAGVFFSWGLGLMISPIALYLFIHGDAERYAWIIRGPEPFSNFGSGPYQLRMYVGLFVIGTVFLASGLIIGSYKGRVARKRHKAWLT